MRVGPTAFSTFRAFQILPSLYSNLNDPDVRKAGFCFSLKKQQMLIVD
jgi:hypothetical protein